VGAPSVTWVLDEPVVVGDNSLDSGDPRERSAVGAVLWGCPAEGWRARRWQAPTAWPWCR